MTVPRETAATQPEQQSGGMSYCRYCGNPKSANCCGTGGARSSGQQASVSDAILTGAHAEFIEALPPGSLTSIGHGHAFSALRAAIKHYITHDRAALSGRATIPSEADGVPRETVTAFGDALAQISLDLGGGNGG